jgi:hypothetical protein
MSLEIFLASGNQSWRPLENAGTSHGGLVLWENDRTHRMVPPERDLVCRQQHKDSMNAAVQHDNQIPHSLIIKYPLEALI